MGGAGGGLGGLRGEGGGGGQQGPDQVGLFFLCFDDGSPEHLM